MKNLNKFMLMIVLLAAAVSTSACSVIIDGEQIFDGRVIADDSFTLPNSVDGNEINESLLVFGGDVHLLEDTKIHGDVVVFGGNADIAGEITHDLVVFGGNVTLSDQAIIRNDMISFGSSINRSQEAVVEGQRITDLPFPNIDLSPIRINPPVFTNFDPIIRSGYGLESVVSYFFNTIAFTALAVLVVLFLPKQIENTADTTDYQPVAAGGLGCLTMVVVPIVAILMLFTIILIPVSLIAFFLLGIGLIFGWVTVGLVVGRRIGEAMDQEWTPIVEGGVGALTVSLVVGGIGIIPCLGGLVWIAISSVGLGAVAISRFGTQAPASSEVVEIAAVEPEPEPKPKAKPKTAKSKSSKKKP